MKNTCTTSSSAVCKPAQYLITLSTECFVNKKVDINIKVILYLGLKLGWVSRNIIKQRVIHSYHEHCQSFHDKKIRSATEIHFWIPKYACTQTGLICGFFSGTLSEWACRLLDRIIYT